MRAAVSQVAMVITAKHTDMQTVLVNAFPPMSLTTEAWRDVCNQESNSGKSHGHMPCSAACSLMVKKRPPNAQYNLDDGKTHEDDWRHEVLRS